MKVGIMNRSLLNIQSTFGEVIMDVTNEDIYRELKLLRSEIKDLKNLLVLEVESEEDELEAIRDGEKEYIAGKICRLESIE